MREILHIDVEGTTLVGTYHRPVRPRARMRGGKHVPAMLLLNFGQVRRAGPRGMSAEIGDRLAGAGYPVFRFDMPGLGDTVGELPVYRETYWRFVEDGGHARPVCGLIAALQDRYNIRSFVLGGLCGGAVTAVYVADSNRRDVAGIVLLEPAVRHTLVIHRESIAGICYGPSPECGTAGRLGISLRAYLHRARLRARRIHSLNPVRRGYRRLQRMISGMRGEAFPAMMNPLFLRTWQRLDPDLPSLVLLAPGADRDFIKTQVFARRPRGMEMIDVNDTNHLFIAGSGKRVATDQVQRWMQQTFPIDPTCSPARLPGQRGGRVGVLAPGQDV